ncbi:MAG: AbrB/MazE/SpoVT family DNA-binding domain-containing protein [Euryarchaeota archaeon]|nr:AbrB/MazE/SpoVT family DNA-binding domain-containing protein [Euryarchaeota archaeon]
MEAVVELDKRGRVTIPLEVREKYGMKVGDKVRIKIADFERRKSFLEVWDLCLKGAGDAAKLKHEAVK